MGQCYVKIRNTELLFKVFFAYVYLGSHRAVPVSRRCCVVYICDISAFNQLGVGRFFISTMPQCQFDDL